MLREHQKRLKVPLFQSSPNMSGKMLMIVAALACFAGLQAHTMSAGMRNDMPQLYCLEKIGFNLTYFQDKPHLSILDACPKQQLILQCLDLPDMKGVRSDLQGAEAIESVLKLACTPEVFPAIKELAGEAGCMVNDGAVIKSCVMDCENWEVLLYCYKNVNIACKGTTYAIKDGKVSTVPLPQ